MKLSLVVPCFNEQDNVAPFTAEVMKTFAGTGVSYELVFINDGSRDDTLPHLKELFARRPCPMQVVSFSRNFGKEAALLAGLQNATGDFVALIDADLQQHPRYVLDMLHILETEDYDAVAAYQAERHENGLLRFFKKRFYKLINKMSETKLTPDASDFRLLSRPVVNAVLSLPEYHRFSKGIFSWVGFRTKFIPYEVAARANGESKWSFWKLLRYAIEGIVGFTTVPLKLASYIGAFTALGAVVYLIVEIIHKLTFGVDVPGYASIVVLLLFFNGLILCSLGIIGEYLSRLYIQSKNRPLFIVSEHLTGEDGHEEP